MSEQFNEFFGGPGAGGGGITPAQSAILATVPNKQDKVIPTSVGNIQGLDALGNTIDLGYTIAELQALISQGIVKVVNTIADRDAIIVSERVEGLEAFVIDATGDTTVNAGGAMYILKAGLTNTDWVKTYEAENLDLILSADNISYDNTTSGATSTNLQDSTDEAFARIVTVENRPVGNSGEGKRYFISTPATAGIYSATEIFTESPTTITKTFTTTYQTVFEAETQALNITAIPSGGWNTDISFTHTNDKDFTAKVSFYNGATLLGEIESLILAGNEKIVLSKTFPTFAFTSGNKLKFKLEAKSDHNGDISVFTNDGTNDLHIHTPVLIDVVNSAVQSALDLKANQSTTYTKIETDTALNLKQNNFTRVISQAAMLALTDKVVGDIIIRTDDNNYLYRLSGLPASSLSNWEVIGKDTPPIGETVEDIITTNEVITSKADGLYAFTGTPNGGFPAGVTQGDIAQKTGSVWTVVYTFINAPASIFAKSDNKVYNKKVDQSNNPTWTIPPLPAVYEIGSGRQYAGINSAIAQYKLDGLAVSTFVVYDSIINEAVQFGSDISNVLVRGEGASTRNNSQISNFEIFGDRISLKDIQPFQTGSNTIITCTTTNNSNSIVITGAGQNTTNLRKYQRITGAGIPAFTYITNIINTTTFTVSNNATASATNVSITAIVKAPIVVHSQGGKGRHVFDGVTCSNPTSDDVVNIFDCSGYLYFSGDYDTKNINIFTTAASLSVNINLASNATVNIYSNNLVILNKSYSPTVNIGVTQLNNIIFDLDSATPIAYSAFRKASALGLTTVIPVGKLIINDDSGQLQNVKCTTAYTIAAALGVGTPIDLTKYQIQTDNTKANDNAVVHLTGAETVAGLKTFSTAPNLSSLTASQRLELDASKNIISVAKNTADNKNFGNTAGEVVEGGTVYTKSEVDVLLQNTEDKFEIGRRIAKQYSSELYDVTAYLKGLAYTNVSTEAQLLAAILVEGFVIKLTNNITVASQINFAQKGVLHLNGFTINASVPTIVVNITKAVIISGGTLSHEKLTDTSVEVLVKINTPANERAILHNLTLKHVEFGVDLSGSWALQNVNFEYNTPFGTATDSHRHIAIKTVLGDCFIDNITFSGIPQVATTRYTNFILADITDWTGNLHIRNVKQSAVGTLRQFLNFQTLGVNVTAGKLIIQDCNFNDLNGGIFFLTAGALDKMEYIVLTNNEQGGDAIGAFKGLLYFSFTGALGTKSKIIHYNNKTLAGALRADYVSLIPTADTANAGIVARQNTVTINAGQEYAVVNKSIVDTFYQDFYRKGENDAALNTKQNITDNTLNTTSKTIVGGINELKTSIDGKVVDAINDGVTSTAPSQNAVFDALALKQNKIYDYTDTQTNILALSPSANNGKTAKTTDGLKEYISNGTAWTEVGGGTADGSRLIKTITQNAHGFTVGKSLALNGGAYIFADNRYLTSLPCVGFVDSVIDSNTFVLGHSGYFTTFAGLTPYVPSFVGINGDITSTPPTTYKQIVLNAVSATEAFFYPSQEVVSATGFPLNPFIVGEVKYLDEVADFTTTFGRWLLRNGRAISRGAYTEYFAKATVQFTGNITNGSNTITNIADTTQFAVGKPIEGVGIPSGATVQSITSNTVVLSTNATATTTGVSLRYFKYGNGDGSTTYNIEDARGRVDGAIGQGTGLTNRKAGDSTGAENVSLTEAQNGPHTHRPSASAVNQNITMANNGTTLFGVANAGGTVNNAPNTDSSGTGAPHNNMQPTIFSKNSFVFVGTN